MAHTHPVKDMDKHFIIDPITRAITNAESKKTLLMQNDHNSEQFSFEINRIVEGHDIMKCNRVEIHYSNIDSTKRNSSLGVYSVTDMQLNEDETKVIFTWLVSEHATIHPGSLSFLILFACIENEEVVYRWNTGINTSIAIAKGMYNGDYIVESYPDILTQWYNDLETWREATDEALIQWRKTIDESWANVKAECEDSVKNANNAANAASNATQTANTAASNADRAANAANDAINAINESTVKAYADQAKADAATATNAANTATNAANRAEQIAGSLENVVTEDELKNALGPKAEVDSFQVVFTADGWFEDTSTSTPIYYQIVSVDNIAYDDHFVYDILLPYDPDARNTLLTEWANLIRVLPVDGIGFKAEFGEAPTVNMAIQFIRVRNGAL